MSNLNRPVYNSHEKKIKVVSFIFNLLITITLLAALVNFFYSHKKSNRIKKEYGFDSISSLLQYTDHICATGDNDITDTARYVNIFSEILDNRFTHGYSLYSYKTNYVASLIHSLTGKDYNAIVLSDDILKHHRAACSQVSIVAITALRAKGFKVRPIKFKDADGIPGHYAYSVWYGNSWHFYDDDIEPDFSVTNGVHPSLEELFKTPAILAAMYKGKTHPQFVAHMAQNVTFGTDIEVPAPNATLFQSFTFFLCYTLWLWLWLAKYLLKRHYFMTNRKPVTKTKNELSNATADMTVLTIGSTPAAQLKTRHN